MLDVWRLIGRLIGTPLLGVGAVRSAIGFGHLFSCLLGNGQAVDAKILADACDDKVSPTAVDNGRKDEVRAEIPQLGLCREWSESSARDGEIRMVDKQSTSNHGREHDGPVWEWLVGKVCQNDLCCHAPEDQGHGQAIQHQVVVFQQRRVRRSKPGDGAYSEDDQRSPLVDGWEERLVPGAARLGEVHQACWYVGKEEGEQNDGDPKLLQGDVADLRFVRWEVMRQRRGPDLRAEVAGHADESTRKDQSLCEASVSVQGLMCRLTNLWDR